MFQTPIEIAQGKQPDVPSVRTPAPRGCRDIHAAAPVIVEMPCGPALPLRLDRGDPLDIVSMQMTAALEDLEIVLLVGQPDPLGALLPHQHDVAARRAPCRAMRLFPGEEHIGVAVAPGRAAIIVQRRAGIVPESGPTLSHRAQSFTSATR
jgi:hypothetical protein